MSTLYKFKANYDGSKPFMGSVSVDEGEDPEERVMEKLEMDLRETPTAADMDLVEIEMLEEVQ